MDYGPGSWDHRTIYDLMIQLKWIIEKSWSSDFDLSIYMIPWVWSRGFWWSNCKNSNSHDLWMENLHDPMIWLPKISWSNDLAIRNPMIPWFECTKPISNWVCGVRNLSILFQSSTINRNAINIVCGWPLRPWRLHHFYTSWILYLWNLKHEI